MSNVALSESVALTEKLKACMLKPAPPTFLQPMLPRLDDGRFGFTDVVTSDNTAAAELHARAKACLVTIYRSAPDVIQLDDPASGQLVARGNFTKEVEWSVSYRVGHTFKIDFKDGRYRYTVSDFTAQANSFHSPVEAVKSMRARRMMSDVALSEGPEMIESLKTCMLKPTPASDPNW